MRNGFVGFAASAALLLALSGGSAQAASVLDVAWNNTCGKASCFDDKGLFKQTFSSSAFSGPMTVSQLLLDRGVLGALDDKTFRISFQLNGEELGTWGKFNMAGIGGDELSFGGENFVWNPEDGDLVLVLEIVQPEKGGIGGGFAGFAAPATDQLDETAPPVGGRPGLEGPPGGGPTVGVVPEPSTWALMIGGFGLAGAMIRRRRAVSLAQP